MTNKNIFDDLIVLELANNHLGGIDRGLLIIDEYSKILHKYAAHGAIKLQIRDVDNFIHKDYKNNDMRYIKKTMTTKLSPEEHRQMAKRIHDKNCIIMTTAFDENSVDTARNIGCEILKIASSDINDKPLIEKVATIGLPVIISTGGASVEDIDKIVEFLNFRNIPMAINHCVAIYPTPKTELNMNRIRYLQKRYPNNVIGFSTHEENVDLGHSFMMAYAMGARTFERHIDIDLGDGVKISPYCSLPSDLDKALEDLELARQMCGISAELESGIKEEEIEYLNALVRGVWANRDIKAGETLSKENTYYAIPLLKGQISVREIDEKEVVIQPVKKDAAITIENIEAPYLKDISMIKKIKNRGCDEELKIKNYAKSNLITAVIPVRAGSRRLPNKNILPFGDSNLLVHKIRQLKQVKGLDNIVVSSDSDEMLDMARVEGVLVQKRPPEYCDEVSRTFNDLVEYIGQHLPVGDTIMWATCVCPLVSVDSYNNAIEVYNFLDRNKYDSVVSSKEFKEYLFDENGPRNFSIEHHLPTQKLPNWRVVVNGFFIASKEDMIKWRFVYGKMPLMINLSKHEAMDIDDREDFEICLSLWSTNQAASLEIRGMDTLEKRIQSVKYIIGDDIKTIFDGEKKVTDTLREDILINPPPPPNYQKRTVKQCYCSFILYNIIYTMVRCGVCKNRVVA